MTKTARIIITVVIVIIVIGGIWYGVSRKLVEKEPIKIGVILPLTGNGAIYGEWGRNALEIVKDEINSIGGINGDKVELIYEDGKFDAAESVNAFNKLLNINQIKYVITIGSSPAVAVSPLANRNKVIQMDFSATASTYRTEGDFTFRTAPTAEQFGIDGAKWLIDHNQKQISVLYINNDQGLSIFDAFKKEYEKFGGEILEAQKFSQNGTDFRTEILKTIKNKDQYIFLIGHLKESGIIVREINELGYNNSILSHVYSVEGDDFLKTAGDFNNKLIYLAPDYNPGKNNLTADYNKKYKEKYREDSEYFGAFAYDALRVLALGISKCSNYNDTECVKNELFRIRGYQGLTGEITFDKSGDRIIDLTVKEVKNGQFVPYKE